MSRMSKKGKRKSGSKRTSAKGWSAAERKGKRQAMLKRSDSAGAHLISVVGNRYKVKGLPQKFVTWARAKKRANRLAAGH